MKELRGTKILQETLELIHAFLLLVKDLFRQASDIWHKFYYQLDTNGIIYSSQATCSIINYIHKFNFDLGRGKFHNQVKNNSQINL